jgi:MFS family permease
MTANGSLITANDFAKPAAALPGARSALVLLLAINMFNYIDRWMLAAVLPEVEKTLFPAGGRHDAELGMLTTAFMVSFMLLAPLFGWLADRVSRWTLVGIGVILWSLASGASGLAPGVAAATGLATPFILMFLTRCWLGVGEAAYTPVAPTMLSDLYPVQRRGQILAWFYAAIPVGSALGFVWGGHIVAWTGDWRWAFYLVVPPGLLLGIWCFFMREPPRGQADVAAPAHRRARLADYLVLLKTPSYVLDIIGYTALTFATGGIAAWMPKYISKYRGAGELEEVDFNFGIIVAVSGLTATLAGGWAGDALQKRFSGSYFLVSGVAMILGFPLLLAALYVPFPFAWVLIFLTCFFLFFNTGPVNTIVANVTHPAIRATGFALCTFFIHALGDVISPPIIGAINDANDGDMNPAFVMVSFLILFGGIVWLCGTRYLARDTALAPTRLGTADIV